MKIKFKTKDVLPYIEQAAAVINTRSMIYILRTIRIKASEGGMVLTASDGDLWLSVGTRMEECEEPGSSCINSIDLITALKNIDKEALVTMSVEGGKVEFDYGDGKMTLPAQDDSEYPMPVKIEDGAMHVTINMDLVTSAINKVLFATNKENIYSIFSCVCLDLAKRGFSAVGCDGNEMSVCRSEFDIGGIPDEGTVITLPNKASLTVSKFTRGGIGTIIYGKEQAAIHCGNYRLQTKLMEGKYPNYKSVIPKSGSMTVQADRSKILGALSRVTSMGDSDKLMALTFGKSDMTVRCQNADFEKAALEKIDATITGSMDGTKIGFNSDMFIDCVRRISGNDVFIELNSYSSPCVMYGESGKDNYLSLLMPVVIN